MMNNEAINAAAEEMVKKLSIHQSTAVVAGDMRTENVEKLR